MSTSSPTGDWPPSSSPFTAPAAILATPPKSPTRLDVHFSSASNEWCTPQWLFDQLDTEFHFDLDAAATAENAKCPQFYTQEMDALKQDWGKDATCIWVNPPYSKWGPLFVAKAHEETQRAPGLTVVMLVPARPDTKMWHAHCARGEVRYLKGRLKFLSTAGPIRVPTESVVTGKHAPNNAAPFPSAIVVFGAKARAGQTFYVEYREPKGAAK